MRDFHEPLPARSSAAQGSGAERDGGDGRLGGALGGPALTGRSPPKASDPYGSYQCPLKQLKITRDNGHYDGYEREYIRCKDTRNVVQGQCTGIACPVRSTTVSSITTRALPQADFLTIIPSWSPRPVMSSLLKRLKASSNTLLSTKLS